MTRLALLLVGDQPAAEDVVQDVFARLYARRAEWPAGADSLPYIRAVVLDAATCNAVTTRGCTRNPPFISAAPGLAGPTTLAINPRTDSVYAVYTRSDQLSVIDGRSCKGHQPQRMRAGGRDRTPWRPAAAT
ncbi:MAG TPA: hypothetical protein VEH31_36140 [Streptosporangiaceae bacterium]|nr:hypothetical protein [Streptosporangiaceae bacterium]